MWKNTDSICRGTFNYKREAMCGSSNEIHLGFVAQEVEESAIANDCYSSAIVWKDDYYKINTDMSLELYY